VQGGAVSRRSWLAVGVIVGAGVLVVALAFLLRAQFLPEAGDGLIAGSTSSSVDPYEFPEAVEADMEAVREAKFLSVTLIEGEGVRSYLVASGHPLFPRLAEEVACAVELPGVEGGSADASLTFVLHDRRTITFVMDEQTGDLWRDGTVYRPAEGFLEDVRRAVGSEAGGEGGGGT